MKKMLACIICGVAFTIIKGCFDNLNRFLVSVRVKPYGAAEHALMNDKMLQGTHCRLGLIFNKPYNEYLFVYNNPFSAISMKRKIEKYYANHVFDDQYKPEVLLMRMI